MLEASLDPFLSHIDSSRNHWTKESQKLYCNSGSDYGGPHQFTIKSIVRDSQNSATSILINHQLKITLENAVRGCQWRQSVAVALPSRRLLGFHDTEGYTATLEDGSVHVQPPSGLPCQI